MSEQEIVPPGTNTEEVTPNPAGIVQPDPPEGGPDNADAPDPQDVTPGFGGDSDTAPPSTE
jgi:hypothetical protein